MVETCATIERRSNTKGFPERRADYRLPPSWPSNPVPQNVCKRDLKLKGIDPDSWELLAYDRVAWHRALREEQLEDMRQRRKQSEQCQAINPPSTFTEKTVMQGSD